MFSRLALLCVAAAAPAMAADQWIRLITPHFELYTDVGEGSARAAILYFEEVRAFFTEAAPVKGGITEFPVRIVIFKNEKQYKPYAFNSVAFAYYTATQWRDIIVMQDAETEHFPTAIHEYMHLIVRHSGLTLPLWLNEGWADVYSTLKPIGKKTEMGALIPGHVQQLLSEKWLDFDTLTSVDERSPYYNETNRAGTFYAESWALVHMLYLTPEYRPHFRDFVGALLKGKSAAEACQIAFGRTSAQVFADLQFYLKRNQFYGVVYPVKLTKAEDEAEVTPASDFDSGLALADLLAATDKLEQAQAAYERLARSYPDKPEVPQSLGYLAWRNGDSNAARQYFEKAFAAGDDDPQMCFHLATLEQIANQPIDKMVPPLLRALKERSDYVDARIELGIVELNAHNYEAALAAFIQLHDIPAERAPMVFNGMAFAYAQRKDFKSAREMATTARKWDKTEAETRQTDDMLRYLDNVESAAKTPAPVEVAQADESRPTLRRIAPPTSNPEPAIVHPGEALQRAEGTMKSLDCTKAHPRLQVQVGDKVLSFEAAEPEKIVLKHESANTFDFSCGPQKPLPVVIEYLPSTGGAPGVAGTIRTIQF